jgi:hypothetical protein
MTSTTLALLCLHLLGLAIVAAAAFYSIRARRLYSFLFAGLLAYQGVMTLGLQPLAAEFGSQTLFAAEGTILCGAVCLTLATWFFERMTATWVPARSVNPVSDATDHWPHYCVLVLICAGVTLAIAARRGTILDVNWQDVRAEATFLDSIATLLQFFVFPAVWIAARAGKRYWAVFFGLVALATFAMLGSRAALLAGVAVVAIDLLRSDLSKRVKWRILLTLVAAGMLLHVVGRIVRGFGLGGVYRLLIGETDLVSLSSEIGENVEWTGGEYEIARYFAFVVERGSFEDIHPLASVLRWIGMYLPRAVAPLLKPEDATYALWRHAANDGVFDAYASFDQMIALLRQGDTGSIHPMLWGEMWANGGWVAVPIAALFLALQMVAFERALERLPAILAALVMPATAVGWLMVARGNSVIGLGYTYYLLPMALGLFLAYGVTQRALVTGRIHQVR